MALVEIIEYADIGRGGQTGGRSRCALRVVGDTRTQAQQGSVSLQTTNSDVPYAPFAELMIGSLAGNNAWNDWFYELQVCKPLSDMQLLDWVNAA